MIQDKGTAIIIVNWNRCVDLLALLRSLKDAGYEGVDTIVVDNGSTDDSVESVRRDYPYAKLIVNQENLGGTGGFNTGLRHVLDEGYEFVWLLDNDALVAPGALEPLMEAMQSSDRIALVGSKLLHPGDPELINEAGAMINPFTSSPVPRFRNQIDQGLPEIVDVDYVAVCSVLARLSHVRMVGLMDPSYFLMWDDMEWGMRFRRAGLRVVAATRSAVFHPAFTERMLSPGLVYYSTRNHLYFVARIYSGLRRWYLLSLLSGGATLHRIREPYHYGTARYGEVRKLAMQDFWNLQMGRCTHDLATLEGPRETRALNQELVPGSRVAVSINTGRDFVLRVMEVLEKQHLSPDIVLFGQSQRKHLYRDLGVKGIWRSSSFVGYFYIIGKLMSGEFDAVIVGIGEQPRWAHFLGDKLLLVDREGQIVSTDTRGPAGLVVEGIAGTLGITAAFFRGALGGLWRAVTKDTINKIDGNRGQVFLGRS